MTDASAWQPIETAPKDGTSILGCWSKGYGKAPHIEVIAFDTYWYYKYDGDAPDESNQPTHWLPLPPPPPSTGGE